MTVNFFFTKILVTLLTEKTPFLNIEFDSRIWSRNGDAALKGKNVSWWALNLKHKAFKPGNPYYGVSHGEVFCFQKRDGLEKVINLSVDSGNGHSTHSFRFNNGSTETLFNLNKNSLAQQKKDELKALKIARELVHHLPDEGVRGELVAQIGAAVAERRDCVVKTIWDKV